MTILESWVWKVWCFEGQTHLKKGFFQLNTDQWIQMRLNWVIEKTTTLRLKHSKCSFLFLSQEVWRWSIHSHTARQGVGVSDSPMSDSIPMACPWPQVAGGATTFMFQPMGRMRGRSCSPLKWRFPGTCGDHFHVHSPGQSLITRPFQAGKYRLSSRQPCASQGDQLSCFSQN